MDFTFNGFRLVIFDLDGTLINSQPLQYKTFNTIFSHYGYPISGEEWIKYWIHQSYTAERWIKENQLDLVGEEIRKEKRLLYRRLVEEKLELKPGALELIKRLYSLDLKLCIASATHRDAIEMIVKKFDIGEYFQLLISDGDVENRKPAPDVFLKVAEQMNIYYHKNCLVIGDSLADLKAAKKAGMDCIICPDSFTNTPFSESKTKFEGANLVVKNLNEIVKITYLNPDG